MNRNDIDIRKGKCCKTDNVRFDEYRRVYEMEWSHAFCTPDNYENIRYLEYRSGYYYYYAWNGGSVGHIYRQRED